MSFARQLSICRSGDDVAIAPNELEWQLARLQRPGMFGERQIQQILQPGKYSFDPFKRPKWQPASWLAPDAAERRKQRVRLPRRARIENVLWQQWDVLDWTLHLPTGEDVVTVPVDYTDDAGLGYYNCRLIKPNDVIWLQHRSIIVNFHYQDDYLERYVLGLNGGCSIEQHEFAHVDMPLDTGSGYLVLGRLDPFDHALELTAFVVKPMQRVYIPAHTIHTNDYLLGRWETLLSSACEFPSAQIKPPIDTSNDIVHEHALPPLAFYE
ncbi:MAG: hypothetical protein ACR2RA_06080 [Geminicoccaceae bacterium]